MRGFVVLFDTKPEVPLHEEDSLVRRFAKWKQSLCASGLRTAQAERCQFYLFSARKVIPPEFNQTLRQSASELLLWVGPRVDMTNPAVMKAPDSHDLNEFAATVRTSPTVLDTAVCISYRAATHSLAVKTDILNATYVYWTQCGRWLLLSNSSLTLARLTHADVDWVAASEFLASGSIYGNHSLYKDIRTLRPATAYVFAAGSEPSGLAYWSPENLPFNTLTAKEGCDRVIEELDKDFSLLNATGRRFVLDLTAGYDSRTNLGFALRNLKNFETTVTGTPDDEDVILSSALARRLGVKHTVIAQPNHNEPIQDQRLADSALLTDLEYDLLDYSRVYKSQSYFDTLQQPSIHGSGGGDIARNIVLRREFYDPTPEGRMVVEPLIAQRFRNLFPAELSRPDLPIADWVTHMRSRIGEYDVPGLPAFARLDIIYLRMRMQFWQARISSSTNRFRSSFSPWTNRTVLDAMLSTRWRDRHNQMLSRMFLRALHPELTRVPIARGEASGPRALDTIKALPARFRYYSGRVAWRLGWRQSASGIDPAIYGRFTSRWQEAAANILRPEAVAALEARLGSPQVLGRLVTLAHVKDNVNSL